MHLEHTVPGFERDRLAVLGDVRLHVRRTHALPFHIDGTGARHAGARRAATAAAATPAISPPPTTVAATATAAAIEALATLPLRALTKSALAALTTWAAKTLASPRPSPLRHGSIHSQKDRTPCIRRRRTIKGRKNYAEKTACRMGQEHPWESFN
jgi:hypothetical protein